MSKFLVSIAIPTYNRQKYCAYVAKQVYELGDSVQVIISDNSTSDFLKSMLENFIDGERFKYIYTREKLSVVENYNLAAQNADGEFFCSIGDDDIVLKSIITVAKWMKKHKVDSVRTSRVATYNWPAEDASISNGLLSMGPFTGKLREIDPLQGTIETLKKGCQSYMESDMCGTYHEIVNKELMNKAHSICGYYYSGFSPDIYSATTLSLVPNIKAFYLDYPISIPGMCPSSATFRAKEHVAISSVEEAIKKYGKPGYVWDERVPQFYMPQTTWAVTMLQAVEDMGRQDLIEKYFSRKYLVNSCCNYNGGLHKSEVLKVLSDEEKSLIDSSVDTSSTENDTSTATQLKQKIKTVYHLLSKDKFRKTGVENSQIAEEMADAFLSTRKMQSRIEQLYK